MPFDNLIKLQRFLQALVLMPHLPQELIDETIGHLWDDFPSLLSCSLSCRAWLPSARTHIFRDQFLASAGDCDRFEQLLEASSDIAGYVRKLSVSEPQNVFYAEAWIGRLPSLMAKLENLEHIEFAKLHWSSQNMPRAYANGASIFPVLARVRCIILSDVSFDTVAEVYDLLAQSPNLRDLCYRRISCQGTTSYMVDASVRLDCRNRVPPRLRSLLLDAWTSAGTVIEWFLAANELELRSLVVRWRDHGNINVLSRLLRACAASLEHLQIEFPSTMTEPGDLNLTYNKALRVLHIDGLA
ncbi:hypothetical protein A0H81_10957 [Grifola frondosa]|uniref:F-box domain-containing protein n=1 Tax=Grifola frondosa TaxID=5627 RepID=A0A1C7LWW8_GRIFR|nr:hypothetical protein A0H81_10957 [Grifola frondosa]